MVGHLTRQGVRNVLTLEAGGPELVAIGNGAQFSIKNASGAQLLTVSLRYNTIEVLDPPLGELVNYDFGAWSCPWGIIRTNAFRTAIDVEVLEKQRHAEFILLAYLSYFTMSRIGS